MQCVRDHYPGRFLATTMQQFMWQDDIVWVAHFVRACSGVMHMPLSMLRLHLALHQSSPEGSWDRCTLHSFIHRRAATRGTHGQALQHYLQHVPPT